MKSSFFSMRATIEAVLSKAEAKIIRKLASSTFTTNSRIEVNSRNREQPCSVGGGKRYSTKKKSAQSENYRSRKKFGQLNSR